ncbi:MAG: aspartate--tRNA ligase [Candidatus Omnitrophota bacterium]
MLRTHTCGQLTENEVGLEVTLFGWIDTIRDHGGLIFLDLRDRYGKTQVVAGPALKARHGAGQLKHEQCLSLKGKVGLRPKGTENASLVTGRIEVCDAEIVARDGHEMITACEPLPFEVPNSRQTNEDLRMKYRFLDLRNPDVQKNLFVRHRMNQVIRRTLDRQAFIEVETPILTKSTPEGARDYLVPSRPNQGEFYALPQSPQLFKQILMVAGFDRYFQIAKCFRDEDLRADRQPEFTQLDMEMSFLEQEDLFGIVESVVKEILKEVLGRELSTPFPRISYQTAMARYGSDKPDLRFGMPIEDVSELVRACGFKVFTEVLTKPSGIVCGLCIPKAAASRKDIDTLTEQAKIEGAMGLAYFKVIDQGGKRATDSPIAKFFGEDIKEALIKAFDAKPDDLIVFVADDKAKALKCLGNLRLYIARWKKCIPADTFHFSWVTDFPLFRWNEEEKHWDSEHHPFTSPNLADWTTHYESGHLEKIRSSAYDLVLNGSEIASGSIRIHQRQMQKAIFKTIGLDEKEAEKRFGFLLKAFDFGPPPHGGIALGLDRVLAILLGLQSIRDVIAFPKNQKAVCPMTEAPSPVDERQLKELGIKIR